MKQIAYNYLIILTVTYIVNILVIHLINMNLENRFHVIFNLLKNNIYLYITPLILSLLILMGSYIQIVTRLSRKQIIAEFD
ncbi:hypothetical protein [Acholeplasma laidlawii]|uniref:hypothetical protein n=1 Tax=Acholeplasma laidlawii TaxID=2148 RepID=UPI00084C02BA|nr:hypothetical protein [Acholeplasma laidlawii]OED59151.1 hypothetical protein BHS12_00195 [Acholeplasma laidlawii]